MNQTIAAIPPSASLAITSKAKAMAQAGETVWNFAAGEPDFDTPEHIKQASIEALASGKTKYAPVPGLPELRQAISDKFRDENGLDYAPEQVVVSDGGKHSLFNTFMALLSPGDEVVIPAPYWLSYPEMVKIAGGTPVFVPCAEENGYNMTPSQLSAAMTDRTRAVVLNTPSNPVGTIYTAAELQALAEVILASGAVYVVADEMYEKILYEDAVHASIGSFSGELLARTITANGLSKAFSMTGWRLGYLGAPAEVAKAITALQSHSTSGANTFAQYGAVAALRGPTAPREAMVEAFAERRAVLYDGLTGVPGVSCVKPMGAFYMLPNIGRFGLDSVAFARRLLDEKSVAVVPGAAFGADDCVRFSYACSLENIEGGLEAFSTFCASL